MLSSVAKCGTVQANYSMPIKSKYLFVASMDMDPDKETLFNEVYDTEHAPNLLKVPGVHVEIHRRGSRCSAPIVIIDFGQLLRGFPE